MLSNIRIVLVQTFHPGNIGASARAMKTMGLTRLTLVNPRRFPDDQASQLAAGADDVLANAHVVGSLAEAVDDCVQVIGASARLRNLPLPHFDEPDEMANAAMANAEQGPVALVFGRERFGLTNDEIRCCTHQVSIPANPDYGVLNLSQAVQVLSHEIFRAWRQLPGSDFQQATPRHASLPTQQQLTHFHDHLHRVMQGIGFLTQPHARTEDHLHALFARAQPTRKELSLLRGLLSAIEEKGEKSSEPENRS
ncbi:tRNA (cytidine32/uridine32-2'-O)-methyltransferase [Modicisalibacter muralis]|uniref:tRNA (cytidine/uridine-2'-O-)-methyltransferase TrmJ n=1 Tax=Modicisalibacter muralis TaxID=119000 RepID=A0A1G9FCD8_9GAMM|nr:RNA methyltransferase [Halomonas muralis]SDK86061.1 tRNA (cytidine32/uridine32-2'-O)-methyltransferase [Halomonas muralis]